MCRWARCKTGEAARFRGRTGSIGWTCRSRRCCRGREDQTGPQQHTTGRAAGRPKCLQLTARRSRGNLRGTRARRGGAVLRIGCAGVERARLHPAAPHFRRPNLSPASRFQKEAVRTHGVEGRRRAENGGEKKNDAPKETAVSKTCTHTHTHVDGTRVDKTRESGRRVGEKIMVLTGLDCPAQQHKQCCPWMAATARPWMSTAAGGSRLGGLGSLAIRAEPWKQRNCYCTAHARIGPFDCRSGAVRSSDSERDLLDASSARWSTRCISGINNHGYKHPSISIVSFFLP